MTLHYLNALLVDQAQFTAMFGEATAAGVPGELTARALLTFLLLVEHSGLSPEVVQAGSERWLRSARACHFCLCDATIDAIAGELREAQ